MLFFKKNKSRNNNLFEKGFHAALDEVKNYRKNSRTH